MNDSVKEKKLRDFLPLTDPYSHLPMLFGSFLKTPTRMIMAKQQAALVQAHELA